MQRKTFRKEQCTGLKVLTLVNKTIMLPFDEDTYDELLDGIFSEPLGQLLICREELQLIVFDDQQKRIQRWIP